MTREGYFDLDSRSVGRIEWEGEERARGRTWDEVEEVAGTKNVVKLIAWSIHSPGVVEEQGNYAEREIHVSLLVTEAVKKKYR